MGFAKSAITFAHALMLALASAAWMVPGTGAAQGISTADPYTDAVLETVDIRIANPSRDAALNDRVEDAIRRRLELFPGARFSRDRIEFLLVATTGPGTASLRMPLGTACGPSGRTGPTRTSETRNSAILGTAMPATDTRRNTVVILDGLLSGMDAPRPEA